MRKSRTEANTLKLLHELEVHRIKLEVQNEEIEKLSKELIITNSYLENLVNYANVPIIVWDPRFNITRFNNAFEQLTGRGAAEVIGKPIDILFPRALVSHYMALINKTLSGEYWKTVEIDIMHSDESIRTVLWNSATLFEPDGLTPIATIAQGYDITERKRAEEELKKGMDELIMLNKELGIFAHANKELEQFAFVASHNLQEPLRTVSNYMQIFEEDYSDQIDDKARKYIQIVNDATKRMAILLQSLLDFSRLGRNIKLTNVDCKQLIDHVIADLESLIITTNTTIEVTKMPELNLYESEFRQLFQNLIMNAIKFRKKDIQPKIQIRSEKLNDKWKFSVSDNGIGIAPVYFERIFNIFQQLHNDAAYQGSGIGLSFCRKIVHLHKGEIWVESTEGEGATFYFTITNLTA